MLDFSPRPAAAGRNSPGAASAASGPNMTILRESVLTRMDLSETTRDRYVSAIDRLEGILNRPLASIPANLEFVLERFPLDGFDPMRWSSNEAFRTWRGRVLAPLKTFLGIHDERARLRAMEDGWTDLFVAVEPLTEGKVGTALWHPMKLKSLKTFALEARAIGVQPSGFTREVAQRIDAQSLGNKRTANRMAMRRLDELRGFPELRHLLPPQPIAYRPGSVALPDDLPAPWEAQIAAWVEDVTKGGWDPIAKTFTDDHEGHAHVMTSALRTSLRTAIRLNLVNVADTEAPIGLLRDEEAVCVLAGELLASAGKPKDEGKLAPRTIRKYLRLIRQLRAKLGFNDDLLDQILANNKTARKGKDDDKCITPRNRRFCEGLIEKASLRRKFFRSHATLRAEAERILDGVGGKVDALSGHRLARVRMLGAAAAFAAIEIGGAPIRVGNAMALTCIGDDAWITVPAKGRKPVKVLLPAGAVKNRQPIEFEIRPNRHGYWDTLTWYMRTIRPLFPHAARSPYLFTAVRTPGASLDEGYFGAQFSTLMRTVVDLPMTPHQMRHGQTSLLLNAHPNEIEVIAHRIGDTMQTLRNHYGWLDALRLVERGQDLLAGLIDD